MTRGGRDNGERGAVRRLPADRHAARQTGRRLSRPSFQRRAHVARPRAAAARTHRLPSRRSRSRSGNGLEALCLLLPHVRPRRHPAALCVAAPSAALPYLRPHIPTRTRPSRPRDEHRDQLRDHDDLAGVRWRDDPELLQPGVRADVAELPGGGGRTCRGDRVHSRPGAPAHGVSREFLGGRDARGAVGAAATLPRGRGGSRVAGRPDEFRAVREGAGPARSQVGRAGHRNGPGGGARAHQEPRHERRRVLQVRIRSRPRRRWRISWRCSPSPCCPHPSRTPSAA